MFFREEFRLTGHLRLVYHDFSARIGRPPCRLSSPLRQAAVSTEPPALILCRKPYCAMSKYREHPVFFDPDNKRWPRLRRGVYLSGLALTVLFGVLILSIIISPALLP